MKYIHILIFLMTHDTTKLKEFWQSEIIKNKSFKWRRILRRLKESKRKSRQEFYWFWWRLANEMYLTENQKYKNIALSINCDLLMKYNTEILLGAKIGKNLHLAHTRGIVINDKVEIGDNATLLQGVTIGMKHREQHIKITIGNNFYAGANSVILGGEFVIGDNVRIGALSFVDKSLPDNCVVYTKKLNEIVIKAS
ncbi:serine acetyltransferase [Zophobihabitans entericus]|uniref:Serine acetyltransferase n=1 Tax=Zophobihabitans entericus TaxID=1635327 RepID=A0A6G9IC20_9GAMM|nr:serine acetyltransferase [Zophobihabitans entericus]QIQ21775.1 serine acetyltransferase [Zophobihabitans entericus]